MGDPFCLSLNGVLARERQLFQEKGKHLIRGGRGRGGKGPLLGVLFGSPFASHLRVFEVGERCLCTGGEVVFLEFLVPKVPPPYFWAKVA